MAQDEFVDLYALAGLEPSADIATIRKRLSEAYIDAQNNLDHRNATKRLQYQQMYEVYLPQARHLLLDAGRRAEYDRYLLAYKSGKPISQVETAPAPVVESGGIAAVAEDIPEMNEPDIDPEVLAHQREELWDKWKSGLNFGDDEPATGTVVASPAANASDATVAGATAEAAVSAPAVAGSPTGTERRAHPRTGARPAAGAESARRSQIQTVALGESKETARATKSAPARTTAEEQEKRTREEWERNREKQRAQIVGDAVTAAGLTWTFIGGGVTFVVALIAFFLVNSALSDHSYPLGLSPLVFRLLGFAISVVLAVIGAVITSKKMREKKQAEIGSLSLEELQRLGK